MVLKQVLVNLKISSGLGLSETVFAAGVGDEWGR